ncbi:hypothetical protein [Actinoplanes sp. NPDC049802]|uniref:hypothetical protein n=1 Tax=Actinoplanes sp. NPDC049802 TaxID=3154742 RepID=UPI0033F2950B
MAKTGLTVQVRIDGLRETIAALNALPKDASDEIRAAAAELAGKLATAAAAAGRAEGRQAALVATTVRPARDRVPVITAGGARKLGRNRKPAFKLLFGSEFGSNYYRQFGKVHLSGGSYWFFETVEAEQAEISAEWLAAADEIIAKFGGA